MHELETASMYVVLFKSESDNSKVIAIDVEHPDKWLSPSISDPWPIEETWLKRYNYPKYDMMLGPHGNMLRLYDNFDNLVPLYLDKYSHGADVKFDDTIGF